MRPAAQTALHARRAKKGWERAYNEIKNLILIMVIRPGEMLSENALAQRLGIGRSPVREALRALEGEGLVVANGRRKRAYVLTLEDVAEIFDLKTALEGRVARWAAERGSAAEKEGLRRIAGRMEVLASRQPPEPKGREAWHRKWLAIDEEFHDLLFQMAGNRRVEQVIRTQNSLWHRLRLGMVAIEGRIGRSTGEHQRIAAVVAAGKGANAERIMEEHLGRLKGILTGIMAAFHYPPADGDSPR